MLHSLNTLRERKQQPLLLQKPQRRRVFSLRGKHPFVSFIYLPPASIFAICESKSMLFVPLFLATITKNTTTIIAITIKTKSTTVCIESSLVIFPPQTHEIGKSLNHQYFAKDKQRVVLILGDRKTRAAITIITSIAAIKYIIACMVILSPSLSIYFITHLNILSIPAVKYIIITSATTMNTTIIMSVSNVNSIYFTIPKIFAMGETESMIMASTIKKPTIIQIR